MNIGLITTWGIPCGIAEHAALLKEAVEQADPSITITPDPGALDPVEFLAWQDWATTNVPDVLHLNYHAALHSRWTAEAVQQVQATGCKVVVTFHDTIGEISPVDLRAKGDNRLDRLEQLAVVADALVVHEPCEGLGTEGEDYHYWRMGVPVGWGPTPLIEAGDRPILGSIGFPFPWKNYDLLAQVTQQIGWGLLLIAPGATPEQVTRWHASNPGSYIRTDFVPRDDALALLGGCDATAFLYTGGNTGQSGSILQGIAARKPVLATAHCRQFRALFADPVGRAAITWLEAVEDLATTLAYVTRLERVSPAIVRLATQESWTALGARYASLYRRLA